MKEKFLNVLKILFAAALLTAIILNYDYLANLDVRELISSANSVLAAAALVLGVYFLKSLVFVVPASLIYVSVGMAFDTKTALLINTVGIAIEVTATFIMGRFLGKDAARKKLSGTKAGDKLLNMKTKNKSLFVFGARFAGIPIDFSSLFFGAFDFKFLPYFFMSLLGILPRVVMLTVLGMGVYNLIPMKYIVIGAMVLIPCAVAGFLVKIIINKKNAVKEKQ